MDDKKAFDLREESRKPYRAAHSGNFTSNDLQDGSLLRIADAIERLAIGKTELQTQNELDEAKGQLERSRQYHAEKNETISRLNHQNAALRGVVTKLKKVNTEGKL